MKLAFWRANKKPDNSAFRTPTWKRQLILIAVFLIISSILFFSAGHLLVRDDSVEKTQKDEVALLLMGGLIPRANHAIELVKKGIISKIIFFEPKNSPVNKSGLIPNEGRLTKKYLLKKGLKKEQIEFVKDKNVSSTYAEASQLLIWVKKQSPRPKKIIVITEWYHTGRAAAIIKKRLLSMKIEVLTSPAFSSESKPSGWWKTEEGFLMVFNEYLKKAYYFWKY